MKGIILCSNLPTLERVLPAAPEPVRFLLLQEDGSSSQIRSSLAARGHARELPRDRLFCERSARYRAAYVRAMAVLNEAAASVLWWAMPFTTKNPISTQLCRNTFYFLLIVELTKDCDDWLIVVTESEPLARQVEAWARLEGIAARISVKAPWTARRAIAGLAPLAILLLAARTVWLRLRISSLRMPTMTGPLVFIMTVIHPHSVTGDGYFRDTYWGDLLKWLEGRNVPVVVGGLYQGQSMALIRGAQRGDSASTPIPIERALGFGEILRACWEAIKSCVAVHAGNDPSPQTFEIGHLKLGRLLAAAKREAHASGDVFRSLLVYAGARRFGRYYQIARCLYPFENRAWEKMLLLGMRETSPATRLVGYQHASLTASHLNFILEGKEGETMPLPDAVVTMGAITREWLIREGHFPERLLKPGCALRQGGSGPGGVLKPRTSRVSHVVVALATSLHEYILTLGFLEEALREQPGRAVRIRPHPTIPLDTAMRSLPGGRVHFSYSVSAGTVAEDLDWADVVLYASSTIGLEALRSGRPSIYLDLGDILDTDPMGPWQEFKWVACEPGDLRKIFAEMESLSDRDYEARQLKAQAYVDAYLYPAHDRNRLAFLES